MGNDAGTGLRRRCSELDVVLPHWLLRHRHHHKHHTLGILSFETAKTMSRLVSLHKSLTDNQVSRLRNDSVTSEGVAFLISTDHHFLLNLACREKIEDLDRIALAVARLGKHCSSDPTLSQFGRLYDQLKLGFTNIVTKDADKMFRKLEKLVATTAELYSGLQSLTDLEISEKRMKKWSFDNNGPSSSSSANFDLFDHKLSWHKQRVRHLRRVSLWDQTFDKVVSMMAPAVCIVYARILVVFASQVPLMLSTVYPPTLHEDHSNHQQQQQRHQFTKLWADSCSVDYLSRPRPKSNYDEQDCSNLSKHINVATTRLLNQLPPSTVGGSGLPLGYANVVIMAERYFMSNCASIDKREREGLYQMLPESLRRLVRSKLKEMIRRKDVDFGDADIEWVILGWEEGAKAILRWLGPMAHDTLRWQTERNVEKQTFDVKPRVLLLQTLFFADRDKTDDAIAELLGSLSCISKYKHLIHTKDRGGLRPPNIYF
ncbi:hypothetical protein Sjap_001831 [Stephania japonica]|uniref:Uncharacterized protein n=1 Tax=Stephania japonica TaxID=461633 RepID=A0AAP0KKV5_9MAGN